MKRPIRALNWITVPLFFFKRAVSLSASIDVTVFPPFSRSPRFQLPPQLVSSSPSKYFTSAIQKDNRVVVPQSIYFSLVQVNNSFTGSTLTFHRETTFDFIFTFQFSETASTGIGRRITLVPIRTIQVDGRCWALIITARKAAIGSSLGNFGRLENFVDFLFIVVFIGAALVLLFYSDMRRFNKFCCASKLVWLQRRRGEQQLVQESISRRLRLCTTSAVC